MIQRFSTSLFLNEQPSVIPDDAPIGNGQGQLNVNKVIAEIADCIENAEKQNTAMDNVIFEICTSIRLANNCTLKEFAYSVFKALLNRISDQHSMEQKQEQMETLVEKYLILFERLSKKENEQMDVIDGLYRACATRTKGLMIFFLESLDKLFYADICCLDVIQKWDKDRKKSNDRTFEELLEGYIKDWIEADGDDSFSQSLSMSQAD